MAYVYLKKTFDELTKEELYQIIDLRLKVFVEEQKILYADTDFKDQKCIHYFVMDQDQIISYLRLIPKGIKYAEYSLGRVVTHIKYRRQGIATKLIEFAMQDYKGNPFRISAQAYLKTYYEKLGFVTVSNLYLEEEVPHYEMLAQNR